MTHINKIRAACFLFAVFLGAVVYAADVGIAKPVFDAVRALPLGDKVSHFALTGVLSVLTNLAFRCRRLSGSRFAPSVGTLVVMLVVVAEEISQIWIPGRNFEFFDLTADFLGIACGDFAAIKRHEPQRPQPGPLPEADNQTKKEI
jgi:VanZ family protein